MKRCITIIMFLVLPVFVLEQGFFPFYLTLLYRIQKQLDSLQVALRNAANDTVRMDLIFNWDYFIMK